MIKVNVEKLKELEMRYKVNSKREGRWDDQNIEQYLIMIRDKYLKMLRALKTIRSCGEDITEYVRVLDDKFKINEALQIIEPQGPPQKEQPKEESKAVKGKPKKETK